LVVVLENSNIAFAPVPKAGCSSIKMMFAELDPSLPDVPPQRKLHETYPTYRFKLSRLRAVKDAFRFTMVRDPIKRLMSVYTDRFLQKNDLKRSMMLKRQNELPVEPDPDYFFQNLTAYREHSFSIRHHTFLTVAFTGRRFQRYDRVYTTDEMPELAEMLSQRSGKQVTAKRANPSKTRLDFNDLHPKTRDVLRPRLEAEYRHLEKYFENPLN